MHHPGRVLALLALLAAGGCVKLDSYNCAQSSECQNGGLQGTCELGGVCSFPDPECPSGKKYADLAGELSGQCVGQVGDTTGPPTTSPTVPDPDTTASASTTFDPTSTTFDPTIPTTSEVTVTTTTSSDPTLTGDPGATTEEEPTCGAIGKHCVDGACCGGCAICDVDDRCRPAPASEDACGVCSFCADDGECALASADTPCPVDCSDIVWSEVVTMPKTACYAYAPMPTQGTCDGLGGCDLPNPVEAGCPEPALDEAIKLAECEVICNEAKHPCIPGGPASAVDMDAYCHLESQSAACTDTCSDDSTFVNPATCVDGVCVHSAAIECGPYACDPVTLMCLAQCTGDTDCSPPATCQLGECL